MRRSRRQTVVLGFQVAGVSLVLLDVLLYFGAYRYTQTLASSAQQQFASLRGRIHNSHARIDRLKKFVAALPDAGKRLSAFEQDHTAPQRHGYSRAAKLLRQVAEKSGAQPAKVAFKEDTKVPGPLLRLGVLIDIEGPFPALLKFAHGLETANDLVLIRSFRITSGENDALDLRLAADFYLTP